MSRQAMSTMPPLRLIWLAPLAMLMCLIGLLGLEMGQSVAGLSETDVIEAMSRRYQSEVPGGTSRDCVARPGIGRAWVVVSCGPEPFDAARHRSYVVDRLGRLVNAGDHPLPPGT